MTAYENLRAALKESRPARVKALRESAGVGLLSARSEVIRADRVELLVKLRRDLLAYRNPTLTMLYLIDLILADAGANLGTSAQNERTLSTDTTTIDHTRPVDETAKPAQN